MSKLENLRAKPRVYEIDGLNFTFKPIKWKESIDMAQNSKALGELLVKTIKENYPDATDDEIENIKPESIEQFIAAMLLTNGKTIPETITRIPKEVK